MEIYQAVRLIAIKHPSKGMMFSDTEYFIAKLFNRKYCFLTGRGASAIYVGIRALDIGKTKAVLPAVSCPSPANVAVCAGLEPVFCDVELDTFGMCPTHLRKILSENNDIGVVIPVHLYGLPSRIGEISRICMEYGVPVIEDAAQAIGGSYEGRQLGSWGDVSIISFGSTKLIDVGFGGAVLTDSDNIAKNLQTEVSALPCCPDNIDELSADWRACYYTLNELRKRSRRFDKLYTQLPFIFREMYAYRVDYRFDAVSVSNQLASLSSLVRKRLDKASLYSDLLDKEMITHVDYPIGSAPWRYSCLVPHNLCEELTLALRDKNIHASNWYPKLVNWYTKPKSFDPTDFPNATRVEEEVLNLWIDESTTNDHIRYTCEFINQFLKLRKV